MRVEPLTERVFLCELLQLGDDVRVPSQLEVGVDSFFASRELQLLDPVSLRPRERVEAEVRERLSAKQRERLEQERAALLRRPAKRVRCESLEPVHVELSLFDAEAVAAARLDPVDSEQLAQPAHVSLDGVPRRRRRRGAPERLHSLIDGDEVSWVQQEEREQRALLRA